MESGAAPGQLAQFHFSSSLTPNIRDKVHWNPTGHSWDILLRKNTASPSESYAVDPLLDKRSYDEAKAAAYLRAVQTWNELDGSSRFRIPIHAVKDGASC